MFKNLINIILGLFGGNKKQSAENEWSSGDYDRYAKLKKEGKEEYLAQKKSPSKSKDA